MSGGGGSEDGAHPSTDIRPLTRSDKKSLPQGTHGRPATVHEILDFLEQRLNDGKKLWVTHNAKPVFLKDALKELKPNHKFISTFTRTVIHRTDADGGSYISRRYSQIPDSHIKKLLGDTQSTIFVLSKPVSIKELCDCDASYFEVIDDPTDDRPYNVFSISEHELPNYDVYKSSDINEKREIRHKVTNYYNMFGTPYLLAALLRFHRNNVWLEGLKAGLIRTEDSENFEIHYTIIKDEINSLPIAIGHKNSKVEVKKQKSVDFGALQTKITEARKEIDLGVGGLRERIAEKPRNSLAILNEFGQEMGEVISEMGQEISRSQHGVENSMRALAEKVAMALALAKNDYRTKILGPVQIAEAKHHNEIEEFTRDPGLWAKITRTKDSRLVSMKEAMKEAIEAASDESRSQANRMQEDVSDALKTTVDFNKGSNIRLALLQEQTTIIDEVDNVMSALDGIFKDITHDFGDGRHLNIIKIRRTGIQNDRDLIAKARKNIDLLLDGETEIVSRNNEIKANLNVMIMAFSMIEATRGMEYALKIEGSLSLIQDKMPSIKQAAQAYDTQLRTLGFLSGYRDHSSPILVPPTP